MCIRTDVGLNVRKGCVWFQMVSSYKAKAPTLLRVSDLVLASSSGHNMPIVQEVHAHYHLVFLQLECHTQIPTFCIVLSFTNMPCGNNFATLLNCLADGLDWRKNIIFQYALRYKHLPPCKTALQLGLYWRKNIIFQYALR